MTPQQAKDYLRPPKRGRPRKGKELRNAMVAIRVPASVKEKYRLACAQRGITMADGLIRHMERSVRTFGEDAPPS